MMREMGVKMFGLGVCPVKAWHVKMINFLPLYVTQGRDLNIYSACVTLN